MILREILETLERIEERLGGKTASGSQSGGHRDPPLPQTAEPLLQEKAAAADEWMQAGIDSILCYQAGREKSVKREK